MLICHLYPDLMNLYGDTGNVDVLMSRCVRRGIGVEVARCGVGDAIPDGVDLLFVGGGQDFDQEIVGRDLSGASRMRYAASSTAAPRCSRYAAATRCSARTTSAPTGRGRLASAPYRCTT